MVREKRKSYLSGSLLCTSVFWAIAAIAELLVLLDIDRYSECEDSNTSLYENYCIHSGLHVNSTV